MGVRSGTRVKAASFLSDVKAGDPKAISITLVQADFML
jgi:hypothetical protein